MSIRTRAAVLAAILGFGTIFSTDPRAYTTNGARWTSTPVPYLVNANSLDLPSGPVISAVQAGADAWALQSTAAFTFLYSGQSSQTTNTNDGINLVLFRDAPNGSVIATTYSWYSGSSLLDTDIVFWDGEFQFFAGTSGCANGFYIEDIAAHEFGHALGLGHSTSAAATMFASVAYCNQSNRLLDADDLAGVLAIYGPRLGGALPLAPNGFRIIR